MELSKNGGRRCVRLDQIIELVQAGKSGEVGGSLDEFALAVEDACVASFPVM